MLPQTTVSYCVKPIKTAALTLAVYWQLVNVVGMKQTVVIDNVASEQ